MLEVILDPGVAPSMFGESIDTTPGGNEDGVEELLAPAGGPQPRLSHEEQECHDDTVPDKGGAHDEMSETLAEMVPATITHGDDAAKQHLDPTDDRHEFSNPAVDEDDAASATLTNFAAKDPSDPPALVFQV